MQRSLQNYLYAKAELGRRTAAIDHAKSGPKVNNSPKALGELSGQPKSKKEVLKELGLAKGTALDAERLARNPDLIAAFLYAKMRLGEATRKIDTKPGQRNDISNLAHPCAKSKNETLKDMGIDRGLASRAEQLAANPDLVEAEIERAKREKIFPNAREIR